jgi:L,D-peptidoglycan transpeptidase YkuD (ErfK/YbiS/YcfS/YnhG family)
MTEEDGWCDDPADPAYNRHVRLPYPASAERLWRDDGIYDIVVVLGHNDDPPVAGLGSAIFLHIARPDYPPTQGCVAVAREDLEALLAAAEPGDAVEIRP